MTATRTQQDTVLSRLGGWPVVLTVWTLLLVLGFGLVFVLGRPLPTVAERLDAAYHPLPPVDEATALASAATIVRFEYPGFAQDTPTVTRRSDFGEDRYVVVYAAEDGVTGVRIVISVDDGEVRVNPFP